MITIPENILKDILAKRGVSDAEIVALSLALSDRSAVEIANQLDKSEVAIRKRLGEVYRKFEIKGRGPGKLGELKRQLESEYEQLLQTTNTTRHDIVLYKESSEIATTRPHYDFDEAVDVTVFYGRTAELATLESWILKDRCRLVALLGMGGIGKTALSVKLAKQLQEQFEFVIWRSLRNAPKLTELLATLLKFLLNQPETNLPETTEGRVSILIDYLRSHRCLLVLDNVESIFVQSAHRAGDYQQGYEDYGKLLKQIGEVPHQSCLVLTSREKPKELVAQEGEKLPVRAFQLSGLNEEEGREILRAKGLLTTPAQLQELINHYAGNPLALKIVATNIQELFNGDISQFLKEGTTIFDNIRDLLNQQFERLSDPEQQIMYWLAINLEPVSVSELAKDITPSLSQVELLEALGSLLRRSLIIKNANGFSQLPVVRGYMLDQLIEHVCEGIKTGKNQLFNNYALIKAEAKDYIKTNQISLIIERVVNKILTIFGGEQTTKNQLKLILSNLQKQPEPQPGYTGGNIINLLVQMKIDLTGYDFSRIAIWQADLQNVNLHNVNFANAHLAKSVFLETLGSILSLAFSSDGKWLATGDVDGEICLWKIVDGKHLLTWKQKHNSWVRSVVFSPDGKTLASGSGDRTLKLWDVRSGKCLKTLAQNSPVRSVAFSHDGVILASGNDDHTVRLWDTSTGKCLKTLKEHKNWVWTVAFSPDGVLLASGSDDRSVKLWDVRTGQCLNTLVGHKGWVSSVAFSCDRITLASGSGDYKIKLWDVRTGQCLNTLEEHTNWVWSVAFSPDGKTLASGGDDRTVRLWDTHSGQCLETLAGQKGHTNRVGAVAFSPDGTTLASGSEDQTIKFWDVSTSQCLKTLQGYSNRVGSVAFSPHGVILASGSDDCKVRLWDVRTMKRTNILLGHTNRVGSVAFSSDGTTLASGSDDGTIKLWDIRTAKCLSTFIEHTNWVSTVTFSPDGKILASGSDDTTIRLWDVQTGQCLKILDNTSRLRSVAFSPNGNILASGSDDCTVRLWDIHTGQCLKTLEDDNWVWAVAFSVDGTLASGSNDGTLKLWDIDSENPKTFTGHTNSIRSVAFSPDGQILASGGSDGAVKLWDVLSEECRNLAGKDAHTDWVKSVTFSPDGQILASGSDDETIKLWHVQTGECLATLKSKKPYHEMNITGVKGLTEAQKAMLQELGAFEVEY